MTRDALTKLLRQGRGAGYLGALESGRPALRLVLGCIEDDPRWDRQVEERAGYYAGLVHRLTDGETAALSRSLGACLLASAAREEHDLWLVMGVLAELSVRGDDEARGALVTSVERDVHREACISALSAVGDDSFDSVADGATDEPSESPRELRGELAWVASRLRAPTPSQQEPIALPLPCPRELEAALRQARDAPPSVSRTTTIRTAIEALLELPQDEARAAARRWCRESWPLSHVANRLLERCATDDDSQLIETLGLEALARGEMYRLCSMLDASSNLDEPSEALLMAAYEKAPYAYARGRAVNAMASSASEASGVAPYLEEALWDCEAATREIARAAAEEGRFDAPPQRLETLASTRPF